MATSLTIRNLPDEVVATLRQQAESNGQSLQAYMADLAERAAKQVTMREWLVRSEQRKAEWRMARRPSPTPTQILDALAAPR